MRNMHRFRSHLPWGSSDPRDDLATRIQALRKSRALSQAKFGEMLGVDQSNVSRWENGAVPDDAHLIKLAELAEVHPAAFRYSGLAEDALHGQDLAPAKVQVVGYVGAGQEMLPFDDHALGGGIEEVNAPEGVGAGPIVAVRIRGDSMHPMRDGWLLFYRRDQSGVPDGCLNRLCVVKLADDGPILVKEIRRGYRPNHFLLTSWSAPPLEDVRVEWAAPVLSIRP